ncbi:MAG: hypothetical protein IJX95_07050 [Lachnospiraceae bacterium]|nr:hypothetical protein [Lachnospiraceae bacterium]
MYNNKKRTKIVALLGAALVLGVCGCNAKTPVQEEQKQENIAGSVTEAVKKEPEEITKAVIKEEEGTAGETESTEAVEPQPGENAAPEPTDTEESEVTDVRKEMEPEELVLHVLTNAEGVHFTDGGAG